MSTIYWLGTADSVAQVATTTFATYDVTTTRIVTIGGVAVSAADSGGTLTAALTAFAVVLNASTNPYFAAITWTSNATQIIGTADTAGCPFVFAGSVSGGTGTCSNAYTVSTASAGPNHWDTATNWSGGAVPVNSDIVIIANNSVAICWGLAQTAVTLTSLRIDGSYTGRIGLRYTAFATAADGATYSATTKKEYRDTYLAIKTPLLDIGEDFEPGSPSGSGRIKIDLSTTAAQVTIHGTASSSSDTGRAAVRLLANSSTTDIYVRYAPGGVGIAADVPSETSTIGDVNVSEDGTTSEVYTSAGVTLTNWIQRGGTNIMDAAATVTAVTVDGGALTLEGDYTITTLTVNDGDVVDNHIKTSGNSVTTAALNGGEVDWAQSLEVRTVATVNMDVGATFRRNSALVITTLNEPAELCSVTTTR